MELQVSQYLRRNTEDKRYTEKSKAIKDKNKEIMRVWKVVEIIEAEAYPDHIHMPESIPPMINVSGFMEYLKGKSSLMIFDKHANIKYRYGNREFRCRGYYVDTVGKNKKAIAEYIRNRLQEDLVYEQMNIKGPAYPFTGEPVNANKK